MPEISFLAPKSFRGRLTKKRTGDVYEFAINPQISNDKGVKLSEDEVPGFAHPMLTYASGKQQVISFTLQLDAEATFRAFGRRFSNGASASDGSNIWDLSGELDFLRSLEHPYQEGGRNMGQDVVLFTFGNRYKAVQCFCEKAAIKETSYSPAGDVTVATVDVVLKTIHLANEWADDVWRRA